MHGTTEKKKGCVVFSVSNIAWITGIYKVL